jgi:hypothetical protein
MPYVKLERILMKMHPELNKKWAQDHITAGWKFTGRSTLSNKSALGNMMTSGDKKTKT